LADYFARQQGICKTHFGAFKADFCPEANYLLAKAVFKALLPICCRFHTRYLNIYLIIAVF
jgi:hypothetical protein